MGKWKRNVTLLGLALLIIIVALVLGVFRLELDLAMSLWAIGGLILAYTLYVLISYLISPKKRVEIVTKVELTTPPLLLRSVKNYRLKVSTSKHIEEKGQERTVQMDELVLSFNQKDHPDAYAYCLQVVTQHMQENLSLARKSHPDAEVVASQLSLPPAIQQLER